MSKQRVVVMTCLALVFAGLVFVDRVRANPAGAAPAAASASQVIFNNAETAFEQGDWAAAAAGFEQVVKPDDGRPPSHSQALIRSRLATSYLNSRRYADARISAKIALRQLTATDGDDFIDAWSTLGDAYRFDLLMTEAIDAYRHVIDLPQDDGDALMRANARTSMALAAMVTDPATAAGAMDAVLADKTLTAKLSTSSMAQIEDLRGRAELNLGNPKTGHKFLKQAVVDSGGLNGSVVNTSQAAIREDAAIAAQLMHDDAEAHEYLAWSNAGHGQSEAWIKTAAMEPPVCDRAQDVLPDDTAVVEFAIDTTGRIVGATPIYASRPGRMGVAFARAVRQWRWPPDAVAKLDPFWRGMIRIQLRCVSQPKLFDVSDDFFDATKIWLASKGATPDDLTLFTDGAVASSDPRLLREDASGVAAMITQEKDYNLLKIDPAQMARLDQALDKMAAPADVRAVVLYVRQSRAASNGGWRKRGFADRLGVMRPDFEKAWPGSRAAAWLELEQAIALEGAGDFAAAKPLLTNLLANPDAVLPTTDTIRVVAVLHMGLIESRGGAKASAQAQTAAAGIKPGQCALLDVRPLAVNTTIGSEYFPAEAQRWGFEGYVREMFDIATDGHVQNVRTVLAYPPFIFDENTQSAVSKFRYLTPQIDGAPLGCTGHTQSVNFIIPSS